MTSEAREAFVWVWLPDQVEPIVAGRIELDGHRVIFNYGQSYLARSDAIPLYLPELPMRRGRIEPLADLTVAGCINDAGPDAWGQRVILRKVLGDDTGSSVDDLGLLTYLLESGSDRVGALDFQASPTDYVARDGDATLEEMVTAADRLEKGEPFSAELDDALVHGSSIGGARPKVLLRDDSRALIAKLSSSRDTYPVVRAEGVAMHLAALVGLDVAGVEVTECLDHDVLLVERFDRTAYGGRRMMVSALTILELDEMRGRYATYHGLADAIRARFTEPARTCRELFSRIVFNVLVGNTDDHARNHAAFWDGEKLTLTPAYDICPQARAGAETAQAMAIGRDGFRASQLAGCVDAAATYLLDPTDARDIVDHQVDAIRSGWDVAADRARLTRADRAQLWGRQILNPYAFDDY